MQSMSIHRQDGRQPLTKALVEVDSYITLMPKYFFFFFKSRQNATFVGKTGVGEMGIGEQVPTRSSCPSPGCHETHDCNGMD